MRVNVSKSGGQETLAMVLGVPWSIENQVLIVRPGVWWIRSSFWEGVCKLKAVLMSRLELSVWLVYVGYACLWVGDWIFRVSIQGTTSMVGSSYLLPSSAWIKSLCRSRSRITQRATQGWIFITVIELVQSRSLLSRESWITTSHYWDMDRHWMIFVSSW